MKRFFIAIFLTVNLYAGHVSADVITDGSIGAQTTISGPNYTISESYGERKGDNVYHSFSSFNIGSGEAATFTVDSSAENIISRVTGGSASRIDGSLISASPNTSLWLLNSSGLIFGKNASIDVNGSFYASTADYLSTQEEELFFSNTEDESVLSSESPLHFGFLNETNAGIIFEGRGSGNAGIKVAAENEIFICGGDISVSGASDTTGTLNPNFSAPSGRVILNAVQNSYKVNIEDRFVEERGTGTLELKEKALINIDGEYEGEVFLRAGKFYVNNSTISAGNPDAGVPSEPETFNGSVIIEADDIVVDNNSLIESVAKGEKSAGYIQIEDCRNFVLSGNSKLSTSTKGSGQAGTIDITADTIRIDNSTMTTATSNVGSAGEIRLNSSKTTLTNNAVVSSSSTGNGSAGEIQMHANDIIINKNSVVSSSRNFSNSEGGAGSITIDAENRLSIDGNSEVKTESNEAGGGFIELLAKSLVISNSTVSTEIKSGINRSGDIHINAGLLVLNRSSVNAKAYEGDGGEILITASNMIKSVDSSISASSRYGFSGFVEVDAPESELPTGFSIFNTTLPNLDQWAATPCSMRTGEDVSSFFVTHEHLVEKKVETWYQNHLFLQDNDH